MSRLSVLHSHRFHGLEDGGVPLTFEWLLTAFCDFFRDQPRLQQATLKMLRRQFAAAGCPKTEAVENGSVCPKRVPGCPTRVNGFCGTSRHVHGKVAPGLDVEVSADAVNTESKAELTLDSKKLLQVTCCQCLKTEHALLSHFVDSLRRIIGSKDESIFLPAVRKMAKWAEKCLEELEQEDSGSVS